MHLLSAITLVLLNTLRVCNALPGTSNGVQAGGLDDNIDLPGSPSSADSWKIGSARRPIMPVPLEAQKGSGSLIREPSFRKSAEYVVKWRVTEGELKPTSNVRAARSFLLTTRTNIFNPPGRTPSLFEQRELPFLIDRYPDQVFAWPQTGRPFNPDAAQFSMRIPDEMQKKHPKASFTYGDIDFVLEAIQHVLNDKSLPGDSAMRPWRFTLHHARSQSAMAEGLIRWPAADKENIQY